MINKNYELKINNRQKRKIMFYSLILIYTAGLYCGCLFAVKNDTNMDYVKIITGVVNMIKGENTPFFKAYTGIYLRDIISVVMILVLKYAGVLKGLSACIIFTVAMQNSCIYTVNYICGKSIVHILTEYILKDTAVCFLIIIFAYIVLRDISDKKYNSKKDVKKLSVYILGITSIYIIDIIIKLIFY